MWEDPKFCWLWQFKICRVFCGSSKHRIEVSRKLQASHLRRYDGQNAPACEGQTRRRRWQILAGRSAAKIRGADAAACLPVNTCHDQPFVFGNLCNVPCYSSYAFVFNVCAHAAAINVLHTTGCWCCYTALLPELAWCLQSRRGNCPSPSSRSPSFLLLVRPRPSSLSHSPSVCHATVATTDRPGPGSHRTHRGSPTMQTLQSRLTAGRAVGQDAVWSRDV